MKYLEYEVVDHCYIALSIKSVWGRYDTPMSFEQFRFIWLKSKKAKTGPCLPMRAKALVEGSKYHARRDSTSAMRICQHIVSVYHEMYSPLFRIPDQPDLI